MHYELLNLNSKIKVSVLCPGAVNTDIFNSTQRNVPSEMSPEPELTDEFAFLTKVYTTLLKRGVDPDDFAKNVVEGIKQEKLYIIPPNDYNGLIELRMQNILERKNPEPLQPPQELLEIMQEMVSKS